MRVPAFYTYAMQLWNYSKADTRLHTGGARKTVRIPHTPIARRAHCAFHMPELQSLAGSDHGHCSPVQFPAQSDARCEKHGKTNSATTAPMMPVTRTASTVIA